MTGATTSAPKRQPKAVEETGLSEADVIAYLHDHPDFMARHPELLATLEPPVRWTGDGVVDMQHYAVGNLRRELDGLKSMAREFIATSRDNLEIQTRAHAAVLSLLSARGLDDLRRIIGATFPDLLEIETAILGFEVPKAQAQQLADAGFTIFAKGTVKRLVGRSRSVVLVADLDDDGTLFGASSGRIQSAALAWIRPGANGPQGLLALGAMGGRDFHPGQATDLAVFLARVVERCVQVWLEQKA